MVKFPCIIDDRTKRWSHATCGHFVASGIVLGTLCVTEVDASVTIEHVVNESGEAPSVLWLRVRCICAARVRVNNSISCSPGVQLSCVVFSMAVAQHLVFASGIISRNTRYTRGPWTRLGSLRIHHVSLSSGIRLEFRTRFNDLAPFGRCFKCKIACTLDLKVAARAVEALMR
ncbi:unnamed protein product, partial [Ectocarpus sp. 13 AM-2016]